MCQYLSRSWTPVLLFIILLCSSSTASALPKTLGSVQSIETGNTVSCAVKADDRVRCWGAKVQVPEGLGQVKQISIGSSSGFAPDNYICAIKNNDSVDCWPSDRQCVNAFDDNSCSTIFPDTTAADLGTAKKISVGSITTCALSLDDRVRCSAGGQDQYSGVVAVPASVSSAGSASDVEVGGVDFACAVKSNGATVCWGDDTDGNNLSPVPQILQAAGSSKKVAVGYSSACVIRQNDLLQCWGGEPEVPAGLGTVKGVSVGPGGKCAIKTNGSLRCWGYLFDQESNMTVPSSLLSATDIQSVDVAYTHVCVSRSAGQAACWGNDHSGQISGRPVSAKRITASFLSDSFDPRFFCSGDTDYDPRKNLFSLDMAAIPTWAGDSFVECRYVRPWLRKNRMSVSQNAFEWGNNPTSVVYLWQKANTLGRKGSLRPGSFYNLPDQTSSTYTVSRADRGKYVRACSIAKNLDGTSPLTCSLPRGPFG